MASCGCHTSEKQRNLREGVTHFPHFPHFTRKPPPHPTCSHVRAAGAPSLLRTFTFSL